MPINGPPHYHVFIQTRSNVIHRWHTEDFHLIPRLLMTYRAPKIVKVFKNKTCYRNYLHKEITQEDL